MVGRLKCEVQLLARQFLGQPLGLQETKLNGEGLRRLIGVWLDDARQPDDGRTEEPHRRVGLWCLSEGWARQNQSERGKAKSKSRGFHANCSDVRLVAS